MGLIFGLLKRLVKLSIYTAIVAAIIVFIPNLPPYTKFTSIFIEQPQSRVGPLAPNEVLNNAKKLYVDKVLGPEAFQKYNGELYTSLATGEIVKISPGGHVTYVTKIGQPSTGVVQEHISGRPLGFEIDEKSNALYVADAYLGIWKVDLKRDMKQLLVSPRVEIEGRAPKLINSLALSKNGDFYWTDSSSDFQLKDGAMISFSDPSGRLFHYVAARNQSKVLLDNLWFPNGVVISPDNQFVVLAETYPMRLLKYYIAGPKKGKSEVFVAGLPGAPDNLRALPDGSGILVGLYVTYDDENPLLIRHLAATPLMRKLLARVQRLIEIPFEYLNSIYPHIVFEEIVYYIGHFKSISDTLPKQSGLLVVDWNGNILESYYNTDGSLGHISDAIVYEGNLVLGTPSLQNFIGSVPIPPLLKKAFGTKAESAKQAKPAETPKPQEKPVVKETPKPVAQEKPKLAKPVDTAKPAPKPTPKPVVQPKPTAKPVEKPKPTAKPVEQPKPTPKPADQSKNTPKPVEQPKPTVKPVEQPKPAAPKPVEQSKPSPKPAQQKPVPAKPEPVKLQEKSPKPEAKSPPTAKLSTQKVKSGANTTPKPAKAKPAEPEPEIIVTRPKEEAVPEIYNKLAPENIPIQEQIPSDTAKPSKGTLKVIKKDGPVEIPNPHL